jgi:hypothetical protein
VRCRRSSDDGPSPRVVTGHGLSTNIIEASLEGYLAALNKLVALAGSGATAAPVATERLP